jgi:hypothetical protein
MDDRTVQLAEVRPPGPEAGSPHDGTALAPRLAGPLSDPRALQILTTEHWSLLSARGLVYNEAFSRASMFLGLLSATLVALGLVATGTGFSHEFFELSALLLALDLFVGAATIGRLSSASAEDLRYLQGMNRLRHAYHETVPGLGPYFISSSYDDIAGIFGIYGDNPRPSSLGGLLHGFTTTLGMVGVINAALFATLVGLLVVLATDLGIVAAGAAVVAFVIGLGANLFFMSRGIRRTMSLLKPQFPSPTRPDPANAPATPPDPARPDPTRPTG